MILSKQKFVGFYKAIAPADSRKADRFEDKISKIFKPGTNVDLIMRLDDHHRVIRPAKLYECHYTRKQMVLSFSNPMFSSSAHQKSLMITALFEKKPGQKIRFGLKGHIDHFSKTYPLENGDTDQVVFVDYEPQLEDANLRSAFRLELKHGYDLTAKIINEEHTFFSDTDFLIQNISTSGLGLLIPNSKSTGLYSKPLKSALHKILSNNDIKDNLFIRLTLTDFETRQWKHSISFKLKMVWKNDFFSDKYRYVGLKILNLDSVDENFLSRFIHNAQLYDIRKARYHMI